MAGIRIDAKEFSQLFNDVKDFDKRLASEIRKGLRIAARPALADVRAELAKPSPDFGARRNSGRFDRSVTRNGERVTERTNVRAEIARGLGIRVGTGKRGGSISIVASGRALPGSHKPMVRLYNKKVFRHPVFDTGEWVDQLGRPYFGSVLEQHEERMRAAVVAAINSATAILAHKKYYKR